MIKGRSLSRRQPEGSFVWVSVSLGPISNSWDLRMWEQLWPRRAQIPSSGVVRSGPFKFWGIPDVLGLESPRQCPR